MALRNLPVGIQSFEDIRSNDYVYVDKTEQIHRIVTTGKIYFLSRPRRFGKSLTVSTLGELFKGNKHLFEGLYIYDKWDWTKKYPVIRIDWSAIGCETPEMMERSLSLDLRLIASHYGINLASESVSDRFRELIVELHSMSGEKVVVLVDEYDAPIIGAIGKSKDEIDAIRTALSKVYKILKATDDHLKFIFLTGISKFAGLSVFSALNNPDDITLSGDYSTLCGITQQELESYFPKYLDAVADNMSLTRTELLDYVRLWYNGYSWDGLTSVYNPFSTLKFLKDKMFKNHWFKTGTPTFLIKMITERNSLELISQPKDVYESSFDSYDPMKLEDIPLLFQTGYLTIKSMRNSPEGAVYTLYFPNKEVKDSMVLLLLRSYSGYDTDTFTIRKNMLSQVREGDASGFEGNLRVMFAKVPYQLHIKHESYYHSMLHVWAMVMGINTESEISTNKGRIDAVWKLKDAIIIIEVKYSARKSTATLLTEAMAQIDDRGYYEPYLADDRRIVLLAVAFAGKKIGVKIQEVAR